MQKLQSIFSTTPTLSITSRYNAVTWGKGFCRCYKTNWGTLYQKCKAIQPSLSARTCKIQLCQILCLFRWKINSTAARAQKKKSVSSLTQPQSAEKPQERTWKCATQLPAAASTPRQKKRFFFLSIMRRNKCPLEAMWMSLLAFCCALLLLLWNEQKNLLRAEMGCLHLGEEPGLWGMLGPPCGALVPWQLSVTSRQMIAVLPEPALPTMTAPRPSQLLVFLRTSSRRVKTQSRPMKAVSAVMPGTSNSSGLSITSACLNGISLPGGSGGVDGLAEVNVMDRIVDFSHHDTNNLILDSPSQAMG